MLFLFRSAIFLSAFLLFTIELMTGKMVLPLYGGVPAVWNTCMVFFQLFLLLGYLYAHFSAKWLSPGSQAGLHFALLLLAFLVLPVSIRPDVLPPADGSPVLWLFKELVRSVGLPFFMVASSAPLLQRWFAATEHPSSEDPYFLYAASNVGSVLALGAYPTTVEALLGLGEQSRLWSFGYAALVVLLFVCVRSRRTPSCTGEPVMDGAGEQARRPTWKNRLHWTALSFVPSSLLFGVTAFITTDLAAIPLLWALPLALYLLTFALVFARRRIVAHARIVGVMPFLFVPLIPLLFIPVGKYQLWLIGAHLLVFWVAAMMCHGELADSRPSARYLTEFYLWMSIGGVLGGVFNTMAAPMLFHRVAEYPIAMVMACLLLPAVRADRSTLLQRRLDVMLPLALAGLNLGMLAVFGGRLAEDPSSYIMVLIVEAAACLIFRSRPLRFGLVYGVLLFSLFAYFEANSGREVYASRNFFGVKRVVVDRKGDTRVLYHGTTEHGAQRIDPDRRSEPLMYYHRGGPVGDVFAVVNHGELKRNIAVVGLGAGSVSAYALPGQHFVYYEIDPGIAQIASDPRLFSFLAEMKGSYEIVLGDGRLTIAGAPDGHYDMILLDAFGSDSIPVHLLTREAIALYLSKLKSEGILVFQITNRFLNLEPLLGSLAEEFGLVCATWADSTVTSEEAEEGISPSHYVVVGSARSPAARMVDHPQWHAVAPPPDKTIWTDQYSSIWRLMKKW